MSPCALTSINYTEYSRCYNRNVVGSTTSARTRRYSPRQPREVRREQILDATLRLIALHGWSGMTMERIAEEAAVAKSVTYAIFESQAGLQRAVMKREQQRTFGLAEQAAAAARAGETPFAALASSFAVWLDGVARDPDSWKLVLLPIDGAPDSVRDAIRDGRERWRQEMATIIDDQLARAGITNVDTDLLAHIIRGNIEYLALLIIEQPDAYTPARIATAVATIATHISISSPDAG